MASERLVRRLDAARGVVRARAVAREPRHQAPLQEPGGRQRHGRPPDPDRRAAGHRAELERIHTAGVHRSRSASGRHRAGGEAGEGTPFGRGSYEIASLAAGGCIAAVDAVLDGTVAQRLRAGAPARPPRRVGSRPRVLHLRQRGHRRPPRPGRPRARAGRDRRLGRPPRKRQRDARSTTIPSVLTISLHQEEHYPAGRGRVTDAGEGAGVGYNLNIPLPAGTGRGGYEHAFERVVLPALDAFEPQLIVVASGLDANWTRSRRPHEPHARVLRGGSRRMLMEAADRLCGGRLVLLHEGGYSTLAVPYCGLAVLEALTGHSTGVPYNEAADGDPAARPLHAARARRGRAAAANLNNGARHRLFTTLTLVAGVLAVEPALDRRQTAWRRRPRRLPSEPAVAATTSSAGRRSAAVRWTAPAPAPRTHARGSRACRQASATSLPITSTPWFSSITTLVSSPTAEPIRSPSSAACGQPAVGQRGRRGRGNPSRSG